MYKQALKNLVISKNFFIFAVSYKDRRCKGQKQTGNKKQS